MRGDAVMPEEQMPASRVETTDRVTRATSSDASARMLARRPGEGTATWFLQNRMVVKATAEQTGGAFGLVESLIAPGAAPPLHVHHLEDESFYVLEGELTFRCGDESFRATAGSFVFLPRGVPHGFVVESDVPVRMLTLLTPGGSEQFFVDAGRRPERDGLPPAGPPDIPRLKQFAAQYGNEIVGPPLARSTPLPAGD